MIVDAGSMMTYLGTVIVAFLGIYCGAALAFLAPKEIKPGKRYLMWFENIVLVLIILLVLHAYGAPIWLLALLGAVGNQACYSPWLAWFAMAVLGAAVFLR